MSVFAPAPIRPYPKPKTLVVLGSSNKAGLGASSYVGDPDKSGTRAYGRSGGYGSPPTSNMGLLTAALQAIDPAWDVINRSLSGTGVATSISRFYTDVAPYRPSHVLFGTSFTNDGKDPQVYVRGIETLIQMCQSIGAIPVVDGAYLDNGLTAANYQSLLSTNQQLDLLGVHRLDYASTLDDGAGHFIGGTTYQIGDNVHNTDAGHAVLFRGIDLGMFINGSAAPRRDLRAGAWVPGTTASNNGQGIRIGPETGLRGAGLTSFTMRARFKGQSGVTAAKAFMCAYVQGTSGAQPLRIRNSSGLYQLSDGSSDLGPASSVNPTTDFNPHEIVMRVNEASNTSAYFIDGPKIGSATPASPYSPCQYFSFGGRLTAGESGLVGGYGVADIALWSVALTDAAILDMARTGRKPPGGLLFDGMLSAAPTNGGVVPNAMTNGLLPSLLGDTPWSAMATF